MKEDINSLSQLCEVVQDNQVTLQTGMNDIKKEMAKEMSEIKNILLQMRSDQNQG